MKRQARQTESSAGLRGVLGLLLGALSTGLWAASGSALEFKSRWVQGAPIFGSVAPGSSLAVDGRDVPVSASGNFVLGLAYDAAPTAHLTLRLSDGSVEQHAFAVEQRKYQTQHISGLPKAMVTPPRSVLDRIRDDRARVLDARNHLTRRDDSFAPFDWPVRARITGEFGAARILNDVPRQPHFGIDMAAPQGTPVRTPAGGIVRMADPDLYYTGGTIILDHGYGLSTTYLHLSKLDVLVGQAVEKGQIIGEVGQTGRATGPHLCWRANWFDVRVDPSLLVREQPLKKGDVAK